MGFGIVALEKEDGPAVWFLNTLAIVKARSSETGGAYGLIEQHAPVGSGTPYHVHRAEEESFYILEGELEFFSESRRFVKGPGAYLFLPRGVPHGYRVVGTSVARFLVLTTPGGFEGFVTEMGEPAMERTLPEPSAPNMDKLGALAAKYCIDILGPLPE
jgi:quercetin dioxygenase-like cupin family protein